MKLTRGCCIAALALPLLSQAPPQALEGEAEPARYAGTLTAGLAEIETLAAAGRGAEALAVADALLAPTGFTRWRREREVGGSQVLSSALELCDPLFEWLGLNGYPEPVRAELYYAIGLVQRAADERAQAEDAFGRARALAGPGELRLASMYNRGQAVLEEGEAWRALIPEISGQAPAPAPMPPAPAPMGGPSAAPAPSAEPDPLALARAAYLRAREHFGERLRADWRDADTRANVELIQRRLAELDEIERQREEEQDPEDQQQDQEQQDQEQQDQEQDQEGDQAQDDQQQQDPSEEEQSPPEEAPQPDDSGSPEDQGEEEQQEEGQETDESAEEPEPQEQRTGEPEEVHLSREELMRLLQQLREHEEEGQMVRERLRRELRKPVERDW